MNEEAVESPRKRPALILGSALILLALAVLCVGAALVPVWSPALLASGLRASTERVQAAFTPEVEEYLREAVLRELEAQIARLEELQATQLSADEARAAAHPAERLTDLLADDRLDEDDCRSFISASGRSRIYRD